MENNSAFYVIQVAEHLPARKATFEEVRDDKLLMDYQQYYVRKQCIDTAAAIWADVEGGTDLKTAAKKHGEDLQTPKAFTRSSYVEGIRQDPLALGAAFGLENPGDLSGPVEYSKGVVIFQLIKKYTPDMSEYTAMRDSVLTVVKGNKQRELQQRWMENLVANADIENYVAEALQNQAMP
jgi:parvulin-like peptidyl-prolyl isomerase